MNFLAGAFLVLMVSTCVTSHFHTGKPPVGREEIMNLLQRSGMMPRGRSGVRLTSNQVYPGMDDVASRSTVPGLLNKPRRVLQPVVIRPHLTRHTRPGQGYNEEQEMQQLMQFLPFLAMSEAGEGMSDMVLPMMLMQRNGLF